MVELATVTMNNFRKMQNNSGETTPPCYVAGHRSTEQSSRVLQPCDSRFATTDIHDSQQTAHYRMLCS